MREEFFDHELLTDGAMIDVPSIAGRHPSSTELLRQPYISARSWTRL